MAANPNTVGMITFSIFSLLSRQAGEPVSGGLRCSPQLLLRCDGLEVGVYV